MNKTESRTYRVRVYFGPFEMQSEPVADLSVARQLYDEAQKAGLAADLVRVKVIEEVVN